MSMYDSTHCLRCLIHGINYPWTMSVCLVEGCARPLERVEGAVESDWKEQVKAASESGVTVDLSEDETVAGWRLLQLMDVYDLDAAMRLAANPRVDLHQAVEMGRAGCSGTLACDILL